MFLDLVVGAITTPPFMNKTFWTTSFTLRFSFYLDMVLFCIFAHANNYIIIDHSIILNKCL